MSLLRLSHTVSPSPHHPAQTPKPVTATVPPPPRRKSSPPHTRCAHQTEPSSVPRLPIAANVPRLPAVQRARPAEEFLRCSIQWFALRARQSWKIPPELSSSRPALSFPRECSEAPQ